MFCVIIAAVYLRVGVSGAPYELIEKHGYFKAGFARLRFA